MQTISPSDKSGTESTLRKPANDSDRLVALKRLGAVFNSQAARTSWLYCFTANSAEKRTTMDHARDYLQVTWNISSDDRSELSFMYIGVFVTCLSVLRSFGAVRFDRSIKQENDEVSIEIPDDWRGVVKQYLEEERTASEEVEKYLAKRRFDE